LFIDYFMKQLNSNSTIKIQKIFRGVLVGHILLHFLETREHSIKNIQSSLTHFRRYFNTLQY